MDKALTLVVVIVFLFEVLVRSRGNIANAAAATELVVGN